MPKRIPGMPPGIRQRSGKYQWDASFQGTRRTGTAATIADAVRDRASALQSLMNPESGTGRAWTLKRAYDGAMSTKWYNTASVDTAEKNARACLEFFGEDTPLEDIEEEAIDAFRKHLRAQGNSNATINRKTSALSVMLKHAYSRKGVSRLPLIGQLRESNTHERYVSEDEERQLIDLFLRWGKREHALAVIILADTGMRSGELFSLRKSAIDWDRSKNGTINLWKQNTKTARSRVVPLTERAANALKELATMRSGDDARVLPYNRHWLYHAWDRARGIMGLGDCEVFTPHLLRHTYCSRLAKAGVPLQKIAYLAGHTTLRTTMRYSHLSPGDCDSVLEILEKNNTGCRT